MVHLNSIAPYAAAMEDMIPVFQATAFSTQSLYAVDKTLIADADLPDHLDDNSIEHYLDINLLRPKATYIPQVEATYPNFDLSAGNNPPDTDYWIIRTDPHAFNSVVTGLFTAGPGVQQNQLMAEINNPVWSAGLMAACIPYICASQLYYIGLGMSVEDIMAIFAGGLS